MTEKWTIKAWCPICKKIVDANCWVEAVGNPYDGYTPEYHSSCPTCHSECEQVED